MIKKRWLQLLVCLVISLGFIPPVCAPTPITPSITQFFFTLNGMPAGDNVDFTLDCYGKGKYPRLNYSYYDLKESPFEPTDTDPINRFKARCMPSRPCYVWKPDDPDLIFSSCDLSGTYKGKPFLLKNISWRSIWSTERPIRKVGNNQEYYAMPWVSDGKCLDQLDRTKRECWLTFRKFNSSTGYYENSPDSVNCENNAEDVYSESVRKNGRWVNSTEAKRSVYYYEFRFDIASNTQTTITDNFTGYQPNISPGFNTSVPTLRSEQSASNTRSDSTGTRRDPVESLYCTILNFFGASC